jgi:hypothetical protein
MPSQRSYGFQRVGYTSASDYAKIAQQGWQPLLAYDDPHLAQSFAAARAAGLNPGLWADPAGRGRDPEQFAQHMAALNAQYRPSIVMPDIEFIGKGYEGSEGWQYNQELANQWRKYLPGVNTGLTPMGGQSDFNYGAWNGIVSEWHPQAYGADGIGEGWDPQKMAQILIDQGVDPRLIFPVLGQGNVNGYQGQSSLWTLDDYQGKELPVGWRDGRLHYAGAAAPPGTSPARTTQSAGPAGPKVLDKDNPGAIAYANKRLGQLVNAGVLKSMPKGDPTAAWRKQSIGITNVAQKAGFANARDFLRVKGKPAPPVKKAPPKKPPVKAPPTKPKK